MIAAGAGVCGEGCMQAVAVNGKHSQAQFGESPYFAGAAHHYYMHGRSAPLLPGLPCSGLLSAMSKPAASEAGAREPPAAQQNSRWELSLWRLRESAPVAGAAAEAQSRAQQSRSDASDSRPGGTQRLPISSPASKQSTPEKVGARMPDEPTFSVECLAK